MAKDEKGLAFFKGFSTLKCLKCQKIQKISNPHLGSYLVKEPNFWFIN